MREDLNIHQKIYDIVQQYPRTRDFLITNGFEQFADQAKLNTMGKKISLAEALTLKKINLKSFTEQLTAFLQSETNSEDDGLINVNEHLCADVNIEGILPCPIKIPLLESFKTWLDNYLPTVDYTVGYKLQSANLGLESVLKKIETGDVNMVPDLLMSAGFELFFDKKLMGQYFDSDVFKIKSDQLNSDFVNSNIDLRDPQNKYLITGVVPAVFLVNLKALNGRKIPTTWQDILSETFANSVAIPLGDLDLFNALIVNIFRFYGMTGIKSLARSYKKSLHPAEMIKQRIGVDEDNPAVSIIPYFFTQMNQAHFLKTIWPEDGAVISPIFMIAKKEKMTQLAPVIDFFKSKKMGEVFSVNGKFPSTNINVDNCLTPNQKFQWVGWDFIHNTDIGALLKQLETVFHRHISGVTEVGDIIA